jgi:hypothetical protein
MPPMSGQHGSDSVNVSSRGLYLPAWSVAMAVTAVVFVVSLAVESRIRLGVHEEAIESLRGDHAKAIAELKTTADKDRSAVEASARETRAVVQRLEIAIAAICAATKARCP